MLKVNEKVSVFFFTVKNYLFLAENVIYGNRSINPDQTYPSSYSEIDKTTSLSLQETASTVIDSK